VSDIARKVGERLRYLRKQRGISQEELAHLASLHTTYVGQLERGEKNATLETLDKITTALGITMEELFRFIQPTKKERDYFIVREEKNNFSDQIMTKIQVRSSADQKMVLEMLDLLLKWKDQ
jgi:transcriptional regulator with XRE-family HTH domain